MSGMAGALVGGRDSSSGVTIATGAPVDFTGGKNQSGADLSPIPTPSERRGGLESLLSWPPDFQRAITAGIATRKTASLVAASRV